MSFTAIGTEVHGSVTSGSSVTASLNPTAIGNYFFLIALGSASGAGVAPTSVSGGNCTWVQVGTNFTNSTNHQPTSATFNGWLGTATGTGAATVTVHFAGTVGKGQCTAQQFKANGPVFDKQAGLDTVTGNSTMPSLTPLAAGELYIGYDFDIGTATAGSTPGYVYQTDANGNGLVYNVSCGAGAQAPSFANTTVSGGIAFLLADTGSGSADPEAALPGPAWQNVFGALSHDNKNAVVFDYRPQFSGAYSSAGDLAFGAITAGIQYLAIADPQGILPGPAWANQFQQERLTKQAVFWDVPQLTFIGNFATAGDIAFGAITSGFAYTAFADRSYSIAGPPFRNQFQQSSLTKQAIYFDYRPQFSGNYVVSQVIQASTVSAAVSLTSATVTLPNPTRAGNTLVACVSTNGNTTNPAVSGLTLGGAPDNWISAVVNKTDFGDEIWYDPNCAGGQTSITVNCAGGAGGSPKIYLTVYEVAGTLTADQISTGFGSSVTSWSSGTTASTTQPNEIFFGVSIDSPASAPVVTGVGGWVSEGTSVGAFGQTTGFQNVSSVGTGTFSGTMSSGSYAAAIATFYAGDIGFGAITTGRAVVPGTAPAPPALPGPALQNFIPVFAAYSVRAVLHHQPYEAPIFGPFCLGGSEADTNQFGGAWTDSNLFGGTEVDANLFGGSAAFGCPPQNINITLGEFNDEVLNLTIVNNGLPFNYTGFGVRALFKVAAGILDSDPTTVILPVTQTNPLLGLATLTIPNAVLQNPNFGFWRVDLVFPPASQATVIYGSVTILSL
jgi:hypothetical protein